MADQEFKKGKETAVEIELAGVIIKNPQGDLLLIHRKEDLKSSRARFEIVGGSLEEGETPEMAAEREAWEEAGLKVRAGRILGRATFIENETNFGYSWVEAEILEGEPEIGEPKKFDRIGYFSWEQMDEMRKELSPNTINLLDAHQRGEVN